MRTLAAAAAAALAPAAASAFEQCPPGTRPCTTPFEFLVLVALPTAAFALAGWLAWRALRIAWLRRGAVVVLALAWLAWTLVVVAMLQGFLAPCASTCWWRG